MNIEIVLMQARTLIAGGWIQGMEMTRDSTTGKRLYCMIGAINQTCSDLGTPSLSGEAKRVVRPEGWNSLADYNDTAGRTKAEVLAAFDKAIA